MPFLGPIIFAWITLIVGSMAYYFLVCARERPQRSRYETNYEDPPARDTRPARPWFEPFAARQAAEPATAPADPWYERLDARPRVEPAARPWVDPAPSNLPVYDMEEFPTDKWGSPTGNGS